MGVNILIPEVSKAHESKKSHFYCYPGNREGGYLETMHSGMKNEEWLGPKHKHVCQHEVNKGSICRWCERIEE